MAGFLIIIIILCILDLRDMTKKKQIKEIVVYLAFMFLAGLLGVFYFSNPERDSLSEILLSLINQEG